MLKNLLLFTIILLASADSFSQVVDRYNYIQKPTDTTVGVAWRTSVQAVGTIQWGTNPSNLTNTLSDPIATSKHFYELTGLAANTHYYYQTSTDAGYISAIDDFYTAKPNDLSNFSFLHYGDCGYDNSVQNQIAGLMEAEDAAFGVVAGDVDQGTGNNYDEVFFGVYQDILKRSCHFTAIGNHDTYADNAATYLDEFYLPTNNPQQSERYYSFTWGNAKFICMDSNIPYTDGTDQYNWLVEELKCNNQQWLFVFFHHPPWTNAWSADYYIPLTEYFLYQGNVDMRTAIVPLFEQYNVDFVLNGHSHCYQRGEMNGVKYVISGGAGSAVIDFNTNSNSPNIDTEMYINQYVRFSIQSDTASYICVDEQGVVVDSVAALKPNWTSYTPSITIIGSQLESTSGSSYAWYLDGVEITGTNTQNYTPTANGEYEVLVTNEHGCAFWSDPIIVDFAAISELNSNAISIYPNPTEGLLYIEGDFNENTHILIRDTAGKEIISTTVDSQPNVPITLQLTVAPGMYFVVVNDSSIQRIIVQ
ncbi:MAG: metallophosphoesterase [Crocinitomicaceae bacterium]|nr:metallophosphoesterase [Crocinitomicaceae bacterium]